jgi:hypothetical protein
MKRFYYYVIWSLIVLVVLFVGSEIQIRLRVYQERYYNLEPFVIFITLFPILVGMVIRLPQLVADIIKKTPWSIDWVKLTVIGLPSLYITLAPLVWIMNIPIYHGFVVERIFRSDFSITTIAGLIFGYVLLDSLKEK